MAQTPLQIVPLSRASVNFITGRGEDLHPEFVAANILEGHRVFGAKELCLFGMNPANIAARLVMKAPARYDGVRLADKVIMLPGGGGVHALMIDPAYAGNIIDIPAEGNLLNDFLPVRTFPSGSSGSVPVYFILDNANFSRGLGAWAGTAGTGPGSAVTSSVAGARVAAGPGGTASSLLTSLQNGDSFDGLIFEFDISDLDGDGVTKPRFGCADDTITWTALQGTISDPVDGSVALNGAGHYKLQASAAIAPPASIFFSVAAPASGDPNAFTVAQIACYVEEDQEFSFYVTYSADTIEARGYIASATFTVPTFPGAASVECGLFVIGSDGFVGLFGTTQYFTPGATARTISGAFPGIGDDVALLLHFRYLDADGDPMVGPPAAVISEAYITPPFVEPTNILPGFVQFHCDLPSVSLLAVDLAGDETPPTWRPLET